MTPNQNANLRVVLDDPARGAEAEATQRQYAGGQLTIHRAPLAIEVKQCVLKYPIGADNRGSLKSLMLSMFGTKRPQISAEYVDALRGVNFTVQRGERVALLGHNGSGKSTLLRAIAGIYPLASGSVRVSGRIGTLFEIGLGFEPEATGRENIYYRGMAMGCSRKMLAAHEEEIVHFCGLGDFIDLPVRTYSAGMFVRLAFAISTQFSPEVLLIDEIFGAGDAVFRERARGRMMKIVNEAGILVMATHDLTIVETVCNRTIWMEAGRIIADGPTGSILPDYTKSLAGG